jgi:streptogramin lyase
MWLDAEGNLYVASYGGAAVIRVDRSGDAEVVARSPEGWSPTGGMVAPDRSLWLLEHSDTGQARVRRIGADGEERVF